MGEREAKIVAYIPVLHKGYLNFFEEVKSKSDSLLVLGRSFIDQLIIHNEIRALDPKIIATMVSSLNIFSDVKVLEPDLLEILKNEHILLPDEAISRRFADQFLKPGFFELRPVFLRWEENNVLSPSNIKPDRVSNNPGDIQIMKMVEEEAQKSSDWWRRIGAVIVKDGQVIISAHNQHEPSEQTPYIDGDPRDSIEAGTHNLLYSSIHAEQMLVAQAAGKGINLSDSSLYINIFPCPMCTRLIAHAGIKECYYKSGSAWLNSEEVMRSFGIKIVQVVD